MLTTIRSIFRTDAGTTTAEYSLAGALLASAGILAVATMSPSIGTFFALIGHAFKG